MTTIATDGRSIAADGRANVGGMIISEDLCKLVVRKRHIYALTETAAAFEPVIKWYEAGDIAAAISPSVVGQWQFLAIHDGRLHYLTSDTKVPLVVPPPFAMGSGAQFAMAAMLSGLSPRKAVEIACRLDVWSGGKIQMIKIKKCKRRSV